MILTRSIKNKFESQYNRFAEHCIHWFRHLPIKKNKIVFIQGNGGGYKCNLKYIVEEIKRQSLSYDLVWLVKSMDINIPEPIRKIKFNRIKALYELATAHIIITNSKFPIKVEKKNAQCFIYIPHGQPGAKCAEGDAKLSTEYIKLSQKHSAQTDIFVSMSKYHTQVLKDTFWVPEKAEILECGFPRNDIYYKDTTDLQKQLRNKLHIPSDTRIAFYAPTFRDDNTTKAYNLDLHRVLNTLEKKTGKKWIFFVTLHPNFIWYKHPPYKFDSQIWNMSSYLDIHELFLISDIVITDYSSVSLDFSNTRRPVFLYASDIDEYTKMRGLKDMFFNFPFPLCKNNNELNQAILNFDEELYKKQLDKFNLIYGSFDDGHASERLVARIKTIMK